jgi:hypothetical protein
LPNLKALAYHHTGYGGSYKPLFEADTRFTHLGTRESYGRLCLRAVFLAGFSLNKGIPFLGLLVACSGNAEIALTPVRFLSSQGAALEELLSSLQLDLSISHDGFSLLDHRPCRTPFLIACPIANASKFRVCLPEACLGCNMLCLIVTVLYDCQRLPGLDVAAFLDEDSLHFSRNFRPDRDFFGDWPHAARGSHARWWLEWCL